MPISFNQFPANWRQPLYWIEVDSSQAGLPITRLPCLMVGQMFVAGHAAPGVPVPIGTLAQAKDQFGEGSQIERMFATFFKGNFAQEVWGLGLLEPGAGVVATGTITVTGPATDAGIISLYIAGQNVVVGVNAADTATNVAANIATEINALKTLPVTAAPVAGVVTLTSRWKGATANDIDVRDSYYGIRGGEVLPKGITVAYSGSGKLAGGVGAPAFATPIANLGDQPFEYVAIPFTDTVSYGLWDGEYGFSDTGRWGWMRELYGHIFTGYRGTYAGSLTWGLANNSGVISPMVWEVATPSPVWECAAAYCAKASRGLLNDPARPLHTLSLAGILPAPEHQRFSVTERNDLSGAGLATQAVGSDGVPVIMRETTSYQLNKFQQSDDAFELVTTLATLARLFRNQKLAITSKYPRHKLADDGTRFGAGQAIVTPKVIKAELIAEYAIDEFNGLVENVTAFKANLIVERDPNNPNRINVLYPPDLVNGLRIFAVLGQFRLQYNRGVDTVVGA